MMLAKKLSMVIMKKVLKAGRMKEARASIIS